MVDLYPLRSSKAYEKRATLRDLGLSETLLNDPTMKNLRWKIPHKVPNRPFDVRIPGTFKIWEGTIYKDFIEKIIKAINKRKRRP